MSIPDTKPISETDRLLRDLDKPSLANLAYALRHPETWPKGFVWRYSDCGQCAMGLAHMLWKESIPRVNGVSAASVMAREFALPYNAANDIFLGGGRDGARPRSDAASYAQRRFFGLLRSPVAYDSVTPEMVADAIDAHLARAD